MHPEFKLNGNTFSSTTEILRYASGISSGLFRFLQDWLDEKSSVVVNTSGSTGTPKPISIPKEFMENSAKATGAFFNLNEGTSALLCLTPEYIAGKMMLVRAMVLGWHLDIVSPVSNPLAKTNKSYDFSAMVPMQLEASLHDISKIKKLIVGGGAVSSSLQAKLSNIPTEVYATYGMTETITHIAVKKLNQYSEANHNAVDKQLYHVLPNISIHTNANACLVIDAPKISNTQIVTNDVVRLFSNTTFIWIGRADNVINSGGVKLHPERIEEKLRTVITGRFFVSGISDKILGEKLIVVIEDPENCNDKDALYRNISALSTLSKYEVPKEVFFLPRFVETPTKKIQRQQSLALLFNTDA
ncbi:AMP-binding protein [Tenacibaculum sp. SG-28]|uniref:AMP-binding protein n=1 Tax=Tenacibaculum sp. SG-28 TaxID=754426 RepID=UPI000CF411F6|nr:AMP-binding protein [Tenacibaculum sp. SG-28]PQJ23098.1 O-succinylbenzoic acid--CoA ligase [Tenacibaculum sp. SG-28]